MTDLKHGDCLDLMKDIPDGSVDAVVCDLPYFKVVDAKFDNVWKTPDEYLSWIGDVVCEYDRILRDNGNLFLFTSRQYNRNVCLMLDKLFVEKRIIIWCRKRGFNTTRGNALASGYEPICYYCKGEHGTFNNIKVKPKTDRKEYTDGVLKDGITLSDVWNDINALPHNSRERVNHPTQKPVELMERIIRIGTNEGDTVLDNCMGSGTTGVACVNTNRNFIGFELDENYFKIAKQRINEAIYNQQTKLF